MGAKYSVGDSMHKKSKISQRYKILDISRDAINMALTEAFADKNHLKDTPITKLDNKKQELTAVKADFDLFSDTFAQKIEKRIGDDQELAGWFKD